MGYGSEGTCVGAGLPCYRGSASGVAPNVGLYPRMHLMPSGLVITCGVHTNVRSWDPAKIRRKSDDSVLASFSQTIDSTSLGTAFAEYTFTLATAYTIQSGDKIMIEYGGPAAVNIEIWNLDRIDGANTRLVRYYGVSYLGSQ